MAEIDLATVTPSAIDATDQVVLRRGSDPTMTMQLVPVSTLLANAGRVFASITLLEADIAENGDDYPVGTLLTAGIYTYEKTDLGWITHTTSDDLLALIGGKLADAENAVDNARLANMAAGTVKANLGTITADPEDVSVDLIASALNFATRAEAVTWVATEAVADGAVITAEGLAYRKSTGATDIADMADWLPHGDVYVGHFGAVGVATKLASDDTFSAVTVSTNEVTDLRAAFDYCLSNGFDCHGDPGRVYGMSSALVWGARTASGTGSVVKGNPVLRNLNLKVIGGSWSSGSRPDADDAAGWTYGSAALTIGINSTADSLGKQQVSAENVMLDGNFLAKGGIWFRGAARGTFSNIWAVQCTDYQERIGNQSSIAECTDSVFYGCGGFEWPYVAAGTGFNDLTLRTAVGLLQQGSDVQMVSCTYSASLYCLMLDGGYNSYFTACKFWAGPTRTEVTSRTVWITTEPASWGFDNCRFDDGAVLVEVFVGRFVNCRFMQSGAAFNLQLRATSANENAGDMVVVGNHFDNETEATLLTKGAGTWDAISAKCFGNNSNDTGEYSLDGTPGLSLYSFTEDYTVIRSNRSLRLMADFDNDSGADQSKIFLNVNGTDYVTLDENGDLSAAAGLSMSGVTHGLGLPSVTTAERNAMTPANGWLIYNETLATTQARHAGAWVSLGAGGGGNAVAVSMAFGGTFTDKAQTVVTGQTWVASDSKIVADVLTPSGTDPDEMYLLNFRPVISDIVAGDGFTVTLYSEAQARGNYTVNCMGA